VGRATSLPWIREEVDRFGVYLRAEKRAEKTVKRYGDALTDFLEWFGTPPRKLTKTDMQRWKGHLATECCYCENSMSTLIAAMNQYVERILERPELKMRPPRRVIRTRIPLTEAEVKRILEEAKKPTVTEGGDLNNADTSLRDHAVICLCYYAGLRTCEVVSLRISDLDLDNQKLRVNEGKGRDFSMVNLSDYAVQALKDYLEKGRPRPAGPEFADCLILSIRGVPLRRDRLWPRVKKIAFRAGIEKNVFPHLFRHSMITHMAEKGLSASFIQAQSRHKSLDMVQRYTHLSEKSVRDAYDQVFATKTKKQLPTGVECVQKSSKPDEIKQTNNEDARARLIELCAVGKISGEQLEKLLPIMDGHVSKQPEISGYA
jgi:integrase/recombinase XerD